jgi:hypothetical protein
VSRLLASQGDTVGASVSQEGAEEALGKARHHQGGVAEPVVARADNRCGLNRNHADGNAMHTWRVDQLLAVVLTLPVTKDRSK